MTPSLRSLVIGRYRPFPLGTRLHVRGRLASLPWLPLLEEIPKSGRVVSIGCGHGAVEIAAALACPSREILGFDIDARKIAVAEAAAAGSSARFLAGDPVADGLAGRVDAILAVDVFYLVPRDRHASLVQELLRGLEPGGVLLVKEMEDRPRWKWWWNRMQEFLACRVFRITKNAAGVVGLRPASSWAELLSAAGFDRVEVKRLDRGHLHPHALVRGHAPAQPVVALRAETPAA